MNGPDDAQALQDAYAWTLDSYREAFGEPAAEPRRRRRGAERPPSSTP
jgi:hypothetical protein